MSSDIRYYCYPQSRVPPTYVDDVVDVFRAHEGRISTRQLDEGLKSDQVLDVVRSDLEELGFEVEQGKKKREKIHRPVLFGENGEPELQYEVDGYHDEWRCGLEVEAGRAWDGNAVYRDLIQAMMMVQVDVLFLAVPNLYKYSSGTTRAFNSANRVVKTLYDVDRVELPFRLVLLGY